MSSENVPNESAFAWNCYGCCVPDDIDLHEFGFKQMFFG